MGESAVKQNKILIVDDVDTNRFLLRDIITEMGHQPLLATNGAQALKIVERLHPQLIISDIAMPEMDGYELCSILKGDPLTRNIPIIFISAYDNAEDIVKGFQLGGEDYVTKPFIPDIVKARVNLHLQLFETNRELSETNRLLQASIQQQLHQIEEEKKNVLYALTRVARENAAYDEKHMERLCANCRILSEAMQLTKEYGARISDTYIDTMVLAAPLCDIGNIAIPTDILQKKDFLDEEEREIVQKHTTIGAKIIKDVQSLGEKNEFLQMSYDIADAHHERWNGTGYPHGLKEKEIPLSAQIVSIVSSYCALTEERAYRSAFSKEEAISIMEEDVGIYFNPEIYKILKMIKRQLK